jgi:hypothetical protein
MVYHEHKFVILKRITTTLNLDTDIPCIFSVPFPFSHELKMIGQYDTTLCFGQMVPDVSKDFFVSILKVKDVLRFFSLRNTYFYCFGL